jgi:hypothetical protein
VTIPTQNRFAIRKYSPIPVLFATVFSPPPSDCSERSGREGGQS